MPLIRINADADRPVLHDNPSRPTLRSALIRRDPDATGPVIIMIHGFKYRPGHAQACPHRRLFTTNPAVQSSWPRALGFGLMGAREGLGIAFGWNARGSLYAAHARAQEAGQALVALIGEIKALWPTRPIHVMSHSLGSEVVFAALPHLPAHSLHRVILMTAASFRAHADATLASPAGRTSEIINVTSRENDLFDFLCEQLLGSRAQPDVSLGTGLDAPQAVTLQLDCPVTLAHLARLGRPIDPPRRRVCHWSSYARRGVLRLYSDLLRHPERFPLEVLRQGLPAAPAPRWSRLMEMPAPIRAWRRPALHPAYRAAAPQSATT